MSGYIYLSLSLLSSLSIAISLKLFERNGIDRTIVIASNYIVASFLGVLLSRPTPMGREVILFAVIVGLLFFATFIVYSMAIDREGIAAAVTFGRISLAIPVLLSIFFWGEKPSLLNWVGLMLIFLVVFYWEGKISHLSSRLLGLFLLSGTIDAAMKYFKIRFPFVNESKFLVFLFLSAFIWGWTYVFAIRKRPSFKAVIAGLVLGVPNFFSSFFLLKALDHLPAYVTFPSITIGLIVLSSLAGYILFKEKLNLRKVILLFSGMGGVMALTF